MHRIYLSGPMTGLPDENYPAFNAEAARLRALGYEVVNPAENPPQASWADYMRQDLPQLLTCDTLALLPDWTRSKGSTLEHHIADELGMIKAEAAEIRQAADPFPPHLLPDCDLLNLAENFVVSADRASISAIQRRFKIGYHRAVHLMELLEMRGTVSAIDSEGQRRVLGACKAGA